MNAPLAPMLRDERRYTLTLALAHLGWWSTAVIVALRAAELLPGELGTISIFTIGLAVAASLSLSRMRLTDTITGVFQAGLTTSVSLNANVLTDVCLIRLNNGGAIDSVDHAEVIGWDAQNLEGRNLRELIPIESYSKTRNQLESGATVTIGILDSEGNENQSRVSIATLGGQKIVSIVPQNN